MRKMQSSFAQDNERSALHSMQNDVRAALNKKVKYVRFTLRKVKLCRNIIAKSKSKLCKINDKLNAK